MWEGYFVEFYQKPKGGSHSEDEAKAKWTEMVRDAEAGLRLSDQESPQSKKPLRVWVPTDTDVDRVNKWMLEKSLELQENAQKKPTAEYINSKRRKLSCNHNEFGGQTIDLTGIGAGIVSAGRASSSNPFAEGGGFHNEGANTP